MGRIGPLARPAALVSFALVTDIVLSARIQVSGAQTMHHLHETIRTLTHGFSWNTRYTGLDVTLGKRQELPLHAAHIVGLTRLFQNAAGHHWRPQHARRRALRSLRRDWVCPSAGRACLIQTARMSRNSRTACSRWCSVGIAS